MCAPTGAGKTNIAMIAILREVAANMQQGQVNRLAFKIVYVAPMKALAAEQTATFSRRLADLGGLDVFCQTLLLVDGDVPNLLGLLGEMGLSGGCSLECSSSAMPYHKDHANGHISILLFGPCKASICAAAVVKQGQIQTQAFKIVYVANMTFFFGCRAHRYLLPMACRLR